MAKKTTKKEVIKPVKVTKNSENKIELENIEKDIKKIEESINNVEVDIPSNTEEKINILVDETEKVLEPIAELSSKIGELETALDEKLSSAEPEEVETIIKEEIKKTEELKKKVEKINNKNFSPKQMTNWWNGMGYDM